MADRIFWGEDENASSSSAMCVSLDLWISYFARDFLNITTSAYDLPQNPSFYSEHWQIYMVVVVKIQLLLNVVVIILFQFMLWCYQQKAWLDMSISL